MKFEHCSYAAYLECICIVSINKFWNISAEPYNIALGKPTDQGPAVWCIKSKGCCTSDLAVDGNLGQTANNRECSHTIGDDIVQRSWWSVDFQGDYFLALIRIYRRSDAAAGCCMGRMNGVSIEGKPGQQTIFNDGNPFFVKSKTDFNITVPVSLRDIKFSGINISIPGPFLTLCEVQVYLG